MEARRDVGHFVAQGTRFVPNLTAADREPLCRHAHWSVDHAERASVGCNPYPQVSIMLYHGHRLGDHMLRGCWPMLTDGTSITVGT
jgi:hypothetical protein